MKRIAIFCDGTWNSPTDPETTHVHELSHAAERNAEQLTFYQDGVGNRGPVGTFVDNAVFKVGGGAFGWGLNRKIKDAYGVIASNYAPGDAIFIFGFSRGAYTARSLAGMIRKAGLPAEPSARNISRAFSLYRKRGEANAPDSPGIWAERRRISPEFATSQTDLDRRGDGSHLIDIAYLGVWDTVGALGIPDVLLGRLSSFVNARHQFHDADLSSLIRSARHALALDERRQLYPPAEWKNLDRLSREAGAGAGNISGDRPYQQVWFVGDHGTVGGSGTVGELTAITMGWIAEGARKAGLTFRGDVALPAQPGDATVDRPVISKASVLRDPDRPLLKWREGPRRDFELHASVRERLNARPDYRPGSLARLMPDLFR